ASTKYPSRFPGNTCSTIHRSLFVGKLRYRMHARCWLGDQRLYRPPPPGIPGAAARDSPRTPSAVDVGDEVEKPGEVGQRRVDVGASVAVKSDAQRRDTGVAIAPQAFAHEVVGTDEVRAQTDLDRDSLAGGLLVAR